MSGGEAIGRVLCFSSEWVDFGSVRLLLFRLEREDTVALSEPPGVGEPGIPPGDTGSAEGARGLPSIPKSLLGAVRRGSGCDLALLELQSGGARVYYLVSGKRLRCVPLAPVPDAIRAVELLSRNSEAVSVEVDPLQRSMLSRARRELGESLYAPCLVGEVTDPGIVALGVELTNHGLRMVSAGELAHTSVWQKPVRRKKKRRRSRRKKRA